MRYVPLIERLFGVLLFFNVMQNLFNGSCNRKWMPPRPIVCVLAKFLFAYELGIVDGSLFEKPARFRSIAFPSVRDYRMGNADNDLIEEVMLAAEVGHSEGGGGEGDLQGREIISRTLISFGLVSDKSGPFRFHYNVVSGDATGPGSETSALPEINRGPSSGWKKFQLGTCEGPTRFLGRLLDDN